MNNIKQKTKLNNKIREQYMPNNQKINRYLKSYQFCDDPEELRIH